MVTAEYIRGGYGSLNRTKIRVRVDGLVNRGGWWGQTYLVEIGMGFESSFFVVEADDDQAALDEFADSKYGHLIDIEDDEDSWCRPCQSQDWNNCECAVAGNDGHRVNLDSMWISPCTVNYFAPADTELGVIRDTNIPAS